METEEVKKPTPEEIKEGCFLLLILPFSPVITALVSVLDAWVIIKVVSYFSTWNVTFGQAFLLSVVAGIITQGTPPHDARYSDRKNLRFRLLNAVTTPLMFLLASMVAHYWFGIGV